MAKAKAKSESLLEVTYGDKPLAVDAENGIIRGVKLLGRVSRNGYEYSPQALKEAAAFYEGVGVNINHPDRKTPGAERDLRDRFGEIRSVTVTEGGAFGDLHFLTTHPMAESICEAAAKFPRQLGMSHNADGVKRRAGGKVVVESIEHVRSVDLVGKPATTNSLFESEDPKEGTVKKTVRQLLESQFGAKLKGSKLEALLEDEGMAAEVAMPADASAEDQIKAAFRAAVMAAFDDEGLDSKATLAKIKEVLAAYDKLSGGEPEKKEEPASEPTQESLDTSKATDPTIKTLMETVNELRRERDEAKARESVRALMESMDREPAENKIVALMGLKSEADRKSLIESWPTRAQAKRPTRSSSMLESEEPGTYQPKDAKAFAQQYR